MRGPIATDRDALRHGVRATVRELADWDRQCFPLGGGNMINLLVTHGLVSAEDAKRMYREAMKEFGEPDEWHWPPAYTEDVGPDGPVVSKADFPPRPRDDEIPF